MTPESRSNRVANLIFDQVGKGRAVQNQAELRKLAGIGSRSLTQLREDPSKIAPDILVKMAHVVRVDIGKVLGMAGYDELSKDEKWIYRVTTNMDSPRSPTAEAQEGRIQGVIAVASELLKESDPSFVKPVQMLLEVAAFIMENKTMGPLEKDKVVEALNSLRTHPNHDAYAKLVNYFIA